jgi:nucleoside-diphosphate-sugar epimerase
VKENILVIGAAGQIGSELVPELRKIYGNEHVFATDIKYPAEDIVEGGPFQIMDVMDDKQLIHFIIRHKITQIYHLAAVLSGNAEKLPTQAWQINMNSMMNILETARMVDEVKKVFWPSSIAVFGPTTPKHHTPQMTVMEPITVYGISKLAGERWCEYYFKKYGVDVRSVRYPGIISYKTEAGGGTTDYAVEIFYEAIRNKKYTSFLSENTVLPMMFMSDAINATIKLMEFPQDDISVHAGYNLAASSFSPAQLAGEIRKHIPDFKIEYEPDFRQEIADSWPDSIDDSIYRRNNSWKPEHDMKSIVKTMLNEVGKKYKNV